MSALDDLAEAGLCRTPVQCRHGHDANCLTMCKARVEKALVDVLEPLREMPDQMAEAWGGDASWLTTGTKVAEVVRDWLTAALTALLPQPDEHPEAS